MARPPRTRPRRWMMAASTCTKLWAELLVARLASVSTNVLIVSSRLFDRTLLAATRTSSTDTRLFTASGVRSADESEYAVCSALFSRPCTYVCSDASELLLDSSCVPAHVEGGGDENGDRAGRRREV